VSGGGSVGSAAGTEQSRTIRSRPAGVERTVDTERVRHPDRHRTRRARTEDEPVIAGDDGQRPVQNDVALVLHMGVPRWRGAVREQELDQREAIPDRLAGQTHDGEGAEKPQRLALPRRGPHSRHESPP